MKYKIAHLTSAHSRYDVRIFLKQCKSLATNSEYEIHLIVADGLGDEQIDGITIHDVGLSSNRLLRMLKSTYSVYRKAKSLKCDLFQLHDPELLPYGYLLKKRGDKVIFDAHEDLPKQLLSKPYLKPFVAKILSKLFLVLEKFICSKLDYIFTATSSIKSKFLKINIRSIDINNYPILGELVSDKRENNNSDFRICYVGVISDIRGIQEVVSSFNLTKTDVKLSLVGKFNTSLSEKKAKSNPGWKNVDFIGYKDRLSVANIMCNSLAGIVTFLPYQNHVDSQPNKMFEYMSAGIPLITSDFPLWKQIVEKNNCGICINPLNPDEISKAIDFLASNPEKAKEMGENGQVAVNNIFNWGVEETKMFNIYNSILCK